MENPVENSGNPSVWDRGRMVAEYLLGWPFMCHAGLVLVVAWIAAYLHLGVSIVCILGFIYLFQIESRQRAKLHWKIHHEEENKASKMRIAEGESVRWMNQTVETIWPMFLEEFTSKHLRIPVSSFLDRFKPWSMKKISVSNISLGKTPPIVTMIRMLDNPVDGDHLAMEASIEWMAAKDMAAVMDVQFLRRISLGIKTTVHICNLCLKGKVKIGIKFKVGWPVIERLRVCFATAPHVQMTIHPLYNNGVDVTELPGIAQWMDRMMADIFARSLVEPNMIEIDMEKLVKDVMIPLDPIPVRRGDFWTMYVGVPVADVIVEVLEATDLRIGYVNGYPDPYVKVTVGPEVKSTKVLSKTLHPKWNETLKFSVSNLEQLDKIAINVRDKDHFYDERLGFCTVNLNGYRDGNRYDIWCELEDVKTGKIHLAITVLGKQAASHSSEDTSSLCSTTFETSDQTITQEFGPSFSEGLPSSAAEPSPKTRVSTRQKLKAFRFREPLLSKESPVEDPNFISGRKSSVIIDSPESKRRLESPRVPSSRGISLLPGDDQSDLFISDDVFRCASTHSTMKTEAEAIDQSSDESMAADLPEEVGEPEAVKFCTFGNVKAPSSPDLHVKSIRSQSGSKTFTNIEEERSATRKIRSARVKLHNKYHRAKQGFKRAPEPSPGRDRSQELQNRRGFGSSDGITVDTLSGQAANSSSNIPVRQSDSITTSLSPELYNGEMDVRTIRDREPGKEQMRDRAKGMLKAAGRFGNQFGKKLNHRKTSRSSDELPSSGELTPIGGERIEVSLSGRSTHLHTQQQVTSPRNQFVSTLLPSTSTTPPQRPPPGLPQPVSSSFDTIEKNSSTSVLEVAPMHTAGSQ